MSADSTRGTTDGLQFDRLDPHSDAAGAPPADIGPAVHCSGCKALLTSRYYAVNGAPVCARCMAAAEKARDQIKSKRLLARAGVFGLGAAIVGAIVYYGIMAATGLEIGIVAILTGFLVGKAVRMGARGFGGRRYQVLALSLTYFSVALAYTPLAVKGAVDGARKSKVAAVAADSTRVAGDSTVAAGDPTSVVAAKPSAPTHVKATHASVGMLGAFLLGLVAVFGLILALPIIGIVGSMPSGLISAAIIGFGMRQAWRMTAGGRFEITGPFRIAEARAPAEG